jgi:hypothetical protein
MVGMTVQLVVKTQTGTTPFGEPIYSETLENVEDVLVGQPTSDDVLSTLELTGKHIAYTLGIPKGDTHQWYDTDVIIWGERFRTIGYPVTGIQENIPLRWGSNVKVERYG